MNDLHSNRLAVAALLVAALVTEPVAITGQQSPDADSRAFIVFFQAKPVGREEVAVVRQADGWIVRGSNRLGPPLNVVTRAAEIHYTSDWHPLRMSVEATSRGQEISVTTTFAGGKAENTITTGSEKTTKSDAVSEDAIVLPNAFLGSYAALSHRLVGAKPGATFHGYIVPQTEVTIRVDGVFQDRIDTAVRSINATRVALVVVQPIGELQANVWLEADGSLLRFSVPVQGLELTREDIASVASRTSSFSLPTDESVRIPASGFNLAASIAKPAGAKSRLPAVVLIGGSGPTDRDETVFGIPIFGHLAGALVDAGFFVVRYDKRGIGQSGGRAESVTIGDYVEDARAVVRWLEKRPDVDKKRIALVGHSEGAWVALAAAAREKRVAAVAMIAGPSVPGAQVVLEQQAHLFDRMKTPEAERKERRALQEQINAAVLGKGTWEGVPEQVRKTADVPWFHSYLSFDPSAFMKDVRQPLLIVQGELDTQVLPYHADQLAELARARKRKVAVDVVKVPGVNHLLLPAKTGEVDEYATLSGTQVAPAVSSAIALWLAKTLGP